MGEEMSVEPGAETLIGTPAEDPPAELIEALYPLPADMLETVAQSVEPVYVRD